MNQSKSLKPQQVMSPANRLVARNKLASLYKTRAKRRQLGGENSSQKAVEKMERREKSLSSLTPSSIASPQAFRSPHLQEKPFIIAKIAKTAFRPPKPFYLYIQNFPYEPP